MAKINAFKILNIYSLNKLILKDKNNMYYREFVSKFIAYLVSYYKLLPKKNQV